MLTNPKDKLLYWAVPGLLKPCDCIELSYHQSSLLSHWPVSGALMDTHSSKEIFVCTEVGCRCDLPALIVALWPDILAEWPCVEQTLVFDCLREQRVLNSLAMFLLCSWSVTRSGHVAPFLWVLLYEFICTLAFSLLWFGKWWWLEFVKSDCI